MALITHRCTKCGHPDYRRGKADAPGRSGSCACGCTCKPGPSEVAPTWDINCVRIERILTPGKRLGEDLDADSSKSSTKTCGCDDCKALHSKLTTV